jgi:pyridinium-3,5-biscarboxylic acid mononucleotide sulfurtransferase
VSAARTETPRGLSGPLKRKFARLTAILGGMDGALVAFSGGVDSTLLLKAAVDVLGDRVLAVIATSETYPGREISAAKALARRLGVRPRVIKTRELENPEFAANPPERCYHCKRELFGTLADMAREAGFPFVLDGSNKDDAGDFRPGAKAGRELGVRSPLREAGLSKADIREISRALGLPTWNKPSMACLASRFPYGTRIRPEGLKQVGAAEGLLLRLGFGQLRVRHHGAVARIEVPPNDLARAVRPATAARIIAGLKKLGYRYVTLDLEGYRTGSLNEVLPKARR